MSSTLEDLISAVETEYETGGGSTDVVWRYGARWLSDTRGWPRVTLVRRGASYEALSRAGTRVPGSGEVRKRLARRSVLEWHCWAAQDEGAENLAASVAVVLFRLYGTSNGTVRVVSERWPSQEDETIGDGGAYVVLVTELVHEVGDEVLALPVTPPTSITHDGSFGGQSGAC